MADLYAVIRKSILFVIDGTHCEILLYNTDFEALEKKGLDLPWLQTFRLRDFKTEMILITTTKPSHIFDYVHDFFADLNNKFNKKLKKGRSIEIWMVYAQTSKL